MVSAEGTSEKKMITLRSNDQEEFKVEQEVALESQTIRGIIEEDESTDSVPLPNVNSKILVKVIEYCKKHVQTKSDDDNDDNAAARAKDLKAWDAKFVGEVNQATLFDLVLAANYLNIKGLLDLTCQTIADMMKNKSPEEIRTMFKIKNDFTPEEEEEIRKENAWAFD